MNNSVIWTIVAILAIIALLVFIFSAFSDGDVNTMGVLL